jgi:hypothetical protein
MRHKASPLGWLVVVAGFIVSALAPERAFAQRHVSSVLIVMSDNAPMANSVRNALLGQGIPVVNVDARCNGVKPALSTLQAYDVVIAWTSCGMPDGVGWGKVLADYVDSGGHLVLASFSWFGPSTDFDGRIAGPGYSPFDSGAARFTSSPLGTYDALHPLMSGVGSVTSVYRNNVTVDPGATLVARWADNVPFAAVNEACNVVGINAYPGTSWTGDLMRVFINGVRLECRGEPPVANAGVDQSVNEEQLVTLDGSGSSDPDGDTLSYSWAQVSGPPVVLSDPTAPKPTFTAPFVMLGGETLTFELTVTANGDTDTDTVGISVVNVNHTPVALAGDDQSIAEGSQVTLDGQDSFDVDADPISYTWVQISGPAVTLNGANTATPSFTAPLVSASASARSLVSSTTLVFKLVVDDGFPQDAPAPGYELENVEDTITIDVSNVNNNPIADAGPDKTVSENIAVVLNGSGSDTDGDALTYSWEQISGPAVALTGGDGPTPSVMTPFVSAGGLELTYRLTVQDEYGGVASDIVVVRVQNANDPPLASAARPTVDCIWPPNHGLVQVGIVGVSDANDNATITIDRVTQDEPTNGLGDGDTAVDAFINRDGTVLLRAERDGKGDGRVYHIHFTASDLEGSASGVVTVCVPHQKNRVAVDGGELYDSTR